MKNEPWMVELLLGYVPAKVAGWEDKSNRKQIISFYEKIRKVMFLFHSKQEWQEARELFIHNEYMVSKTIEILEYCYEANQNNSVRISFGVNERMKIDVTHSESRKTIFVRIPVNREGW